MEVQFAECYADLVQSNLFALSFEFLIQQSVSRSWMLQRRLAHLFVQCVTVLPLRMAR